jgi:hypothetical protein
MRIWTPLGFSRGSRALFVSLLALLLLIAAHTLPAVAQQTDSSSPLIALPLPLEARPANGAIQDTQLLTSFPVLNTGKVVVNAFRVTTTTLKIGAKTVPGTIVGGTVTIAAGAKGVSYASFPSASLVPGSPTLTIVGSCNVSGVVLTFTLTTPLHIAVKSPGSATAGKGTAIVTRVLAGPYPGPALEPKEANEDEDYPAVPIGPVHPLTHSPAVTIAAAPAIAVDPNGLEVYNQFTPFVGTQNGLPVEPSGATAATAGDVALVVSNTGDAFSINGGASWTFLTPGGAKGMFPATEGGFCCDQIVHYVPPPIDRFVWLMQYWGPKGGGSLVGPNLERIAVASPASIVAHVADPKAAWSFFDLTPAELNLGTDFFDYPDLSVGDNNLFVSFDDVGKGLVVVRISLDTIKIVGDSDDITFQFTNPSDSSVAYGSHLTQNPGASIFWAGHNSNSNMRVFSWPDGSNIYSWQNVDIGSWPNNSSNMVALTPTPPTPAPNWVSKLQSWPTFAILGSTRAAGPLSPAGGSEEQLYFAWTASSGSGFNFPQVQWVTLGISPITFATQRQLQSPNTAVAYPALNTNSEGEVGVSAETGGGSTFENHAIGFLIDNKLFTTTKSNFGVPRFGDYVTIRRDQANPAHFDAFGYGEDHSSSGGTEPVLFTIFGRPPTPTYDIFTIGIGTGDDNAESGTEVIAQLSGQNAICAKQSDSIAANAVCPGNGNSSPTWNNFTTWDPGTPFPLNNPKTGLAGFGTLTISLVQENPGCSSSCDNWDLQSINVVAIDSTGKLPPLVLLNMSEPNTGTNNCIARLKGAHNGNATAITFGKLGTATPTHVYANGTFTGETTTCINNGGP